MERTVLAVDLGGTKILACVVRGAKVLASHKLKTEAVKGPSAVMRQIVEAGEAAAQAAGLRIARLGGVGVAVPGIVDPREGSVLQAPNLGWRRYPARERLSKAFRRRVRVANDVNAGLMGEAAFGALRPHARDAVAGFFVGTGVGGGLMLGGRLIEGASGAAGELGHMTLEPNGPLCGCGNRGCLEALSSRSAIERRLGRKRGKLSSGKIKKALEKGDKRVEKTLRRAAGWLGIGVANVINIYNPRAVVLGGGLMEAVGEDLLPLVAAAAKKRALPSAYASCSLLLSRLGDRAVPLGMAVLTLGPNRP